VDTVDPVINFNPPPPVFDPPLDQAVLLPGDVTFTTSWNVDGADLASELSISCAVSNALQTETITPSSTVYENGTLQATFDYAFQVGATQLACTITDQGGNSDTSDPFEILVEDVPEISAINAMLTLPADNGSSATVFDSELTANITVSDRIDADLSAAVSCLAGESQDFSIGQHEIECSVTDSGGNSASTTFTLDVVFPYAIVILEPKGNIQAGSSLPVDFYYEDAQVQPPLRVDSSRLDVGASWIGPYSNRACTVEGNQFGMGNGQSTGSSDFRYSASRDEWQFNWQTPALPGCYKFTISPSGSGAPTINVNTK
jgi:hypothetical protein